MAKNTEKKRFTHLSDRAWCRDDQISASANGEGKNGERGEAGEHGLLRCGFRWKTSVEVQVSVSLLFYVQLMAIICRE